jgi:hypothetical protein
VKRTKEWWARLDKDERCQLVMLERDANHYGGLGGYLPDDCGECPHCSYPALGGGLCRDCRNELFVLLAKANGGGI